MSVVAVVVVILLALGALWLLSSSPIDRDAWK